MHRNCLKHAVAALACAVPLLAAAADEAPPQGAFGRALFGDDFGKGNGLVMGGWLEVGYAVNNHSDPGGRGLANSPVVIARDEGIQLNQLSLYLEKTINTNIITRVTPTPAPMPQSYDWGFKIMALYGRDGQPVQMFGWDSNITANRPGNEDPANAALFRQQFLVYPEAHLNFYMPWWQGMSLMLGNFMSPVGYEIGFAGEPSPNIFYTRTYAFAAAPISHSGALFAFNMVNNQAMLLSGELGVVRGWSNFKDNNGKPAYLGAIRWRTPDMKQWVDLEVITGDAQADPGKVDVNNPDSINVPVTRVISPNSLNKTEAHLSWSGDIGMQWHGIVELTYGKMKGDGSPQTIDVVNGPGFSGATWSGIQGQLQYKIDAKLAVAGRLEVFRDRDGFALFPNTTVAGDFYAATAGLQWRPAKNLLIRPELRYDWQGHNNGVDAFAGGTKSNQLLFATDIVLQY